jgi:transketolase
MADAIRVLAMDAVEAAKSGHPGMPMGMADAATVLFARHLSFDPVAPDWPDRDRFVLSAGHGSMLLYALLHLTGYPGVSREELRRFRQLGSLTPGHPEVGTTPGVETTTGPLGQGLANAVGMALAERMLAARFGDGLVDHRTWAIVGDGCLMEGISHEAISLAGHLKLAKLCVLFDDNRISIDGATDLTVSDDQLARFRACGWAAEAVDGHDMGAVAAALDRAIASDRPSLIACRTTIAWGAPTKAGSAASHGAPLGAAEIAGAREAYGWLHAPFDLPEPVVDWWRAVGRRGTGRRAAWVARHAALPADRRAAFDRMISGRAPEGLAKAILTVKRELAALPKLETRRASGAVIEALTPIMPELIGGSADLTGSNNTRAKGAKPVTAAAFDGTYLHWGVREHAMVAAMNGMALHGGFLPFAGSFLVFTDYCRPAIRLAALMGRRVILVMTHDSIGLGEDGPTHQAVEQLAGLRAIPGLAVFRPADAVETAECWEAALAWDGPSVLALTRQPVPTLTAALDENRAARGGYLLTAPEGERRATVIATGSEVQVARDAAELLAAEGVPTAVVSLPCWELFDRQPADYRQAVLGTAPRVAVEAAIPLGWERYVGDAAHVVGMTGFGASAPWETLFPHFGITAAAVAARVRARLGR